MKKQAAALKAETSRLPGESPQSTRGDGGPSVGTQAQEESYLEDRFTPVALSLVMKEAAD